MTSSLLRRRWVPSVLTLGGIIAATVAAIVLSAALGGDAAAQSAGPGLRVYVSDIHDQGDKESSTTPAFVRMVAARNGAYSGKVVATSAGKGITGLKAACSALKGPGGSIAATNIQIRYGLPWVAKRSWLQRGITPNACLSESPAAEYAAGAAAPIWVTVNVPKETAPGLYTGEIAVGAAGAPPARVPVKLTVVDWTLPNPHEYVSWIDFVQAPDTSAVEYKLTLWTPQHWQMIERSLKLLGQLGNKTLYIPLIAHTNTGNEESMVRWIDRGGGKYDYDFTTVDKYLDLAEKHMGKPQVVILQVWELYNLPASDARTDEEVRATVKGPRGQAITQARQAMNIVEKGGKIGLGPMVTVVKSPGGKPELVTLPPYTDPASKALWAPLMAKMKERLSQRGLGQAMMLGLCSDAWVSKDEIVLFNEITGSAPWVVESHYGFPDSEKRLMHEVGKVGYQTRVWGGIRFADGQKQTNQALPPSAETNLGWKGTERVAVFERNEGLDLYPMARWRHFVETCVTSTARGVGRLGGDFWWSIRDKRDQRVGHVADRFPEANWRNLNICNSILAAAPEGPAPSDRYMAFREGLQESEARIAIERVLSDEKLKAQLGADLAAKAQTMLDERLAAMWKSLSRDPNGTCAMWRWEPGGGGQTWFLTSGWQDRSEKLYSVAGEVARRLAGR